LNSHSETTPPEPQRATPWKRDYNRRWYQEHRKAEYLSPRELEQCRESPALARRIRGTAVIACLDCGVLLEKLPQHLAAEHGTTSAEYKRRFGLPKNHPLCSENFSDRMTAIKKASGRVPPVETRFGQARGPSARQGVQARREWGVSLVERQAKRNRMLTEESRRSHTAWWAKAHKPKLSSEDILKIVERRLGGQSLKTIAKHFKVTQSAVARRLRKMGFPAGRECVFYHGEPLTRQHLRLLIQDYIAVNYPAPQSAPPLSLKPHEQRTIEEAAERLGVSPSWVRERTRKRSHLRLGVRRGKRLYLGNAQIQYLIEERERIRREELEGRARREITDALHVNPHWITHRLRAKDKSRPLSAKMGGRILVFWRGLKDRWHTQSASPKGGQPKKLLPSEQAALRRRYQSLQKDLKRLNAWLRADRVYSRRRAREWICEQAERGRLRTLLFWPKFFRWVEEGFDLEGVGVDRPTFLQGQWTPSEVALDFLAGDYGLAPRTVADLVRSSHSVALHSTP
jgi:transposase